MTFVSSTNYNESRDGRPKLMASARPKYFVVSTKFRHKARGGVASPVFEAKADDRSLSCFLRPHVHCCQRRGQRLVQRLQADGQRPELVSELPADLTEQFKYGILVLELSAAL